MKDEYNYTGLPFESDSQRAYAKHLLKCIYNTSIPFIPSCHLRQFRPNKVGTGKAVFSFELPKNSRALVTWGFPLSMQSATDSTVYIPASAFVFFQTMAPGVTGVTNGYLGGVTVPDEGLPANFMSGWTVEPQITVPSPDIAVVDSHGAEDVSTYIFAPGPGVLSVECVKSNMLQGDPILRAVDPIGLGFVFGTKGESPHTGYDSWSDRPDITHTTGATHRCTAPYVCGPTASVATQYPGIAPKAALYASITDSAVVDEDMIMAYNGGYYGSDPEHDGKYFQDYVMSRTTSAIEIGNFNNDNAISVNVEVTRQFAWAMRPAVVSNDPSTQISETLQAPDPRLVSIWNGHGGVGRTKLEASNNSVGNHLRHMQKNGVYSKTAISALKEAGQWGLNALKKGGSYLANQVWNANQDKIRALGGRVSGAAVGLGSAAIASGVSSIDEILGSIGLGLMAF